LLGIEIHFQLLWTLVDDGLLHPVLLLALEQSSFTCESAFNIFQLEVAALREGREEKFS